MFDSPYSKITTADNNDDEIEILFKKGISVLLYPLIFFLLNFFNSTILLIQQSGKKIKKQKVKSHTEIDMSNTIPPNKSLIR